MSELLIIHYASLKNIKFEKNHSSGKQNILDFLHNVYYFRHFVSIIGVLLDIIILQRLIREGSGMKKERHLLWEGTLAVLHMFPQLHYERQGLGSEQQYQQSKQQSV